MLTEPEVKGAFKETPSGGIAMDRLAIPCAELTSLFSTTATLHRHLPSSFFYRKKTKIKFLLN